MAVLARRSPKIGRLSGDFVESRGREGHPSILATLHNQAETVQQHQRMADVGPMWALHG
jgi:hypothetical protein